MTGHNVRMVPVWQCLAVAPGVQHSDYFPQFSTPAVHLGTGGLRNKRRKHGGVTFHKVKMIAKIAS
jgi:hypothetical protein